MAKGSCNVLYFLVYILYVSVHNKNNIENLQALQALFSIINICPPNFTNSLILQCDDRVCSCCLEQSLDYHADSAE